MKKKLAKELKEYYDELEEGLKNTYIMKVKPKLRPSGNSKGGMIDYRKTGLFR